MNVNVVTETQPIVSPPTIIQQKKTIEWKWSKGEQYERSLRPTEKKALTTSPNSICASDKCMLQEYTRKYNKRDEQNEKLSGREMMAQTSINPFMKKQNYLDDIKQENTYLRPQKTW
jgi:hypothetical protein